MTEYAKSKGLKKGDYKKLNLPFENKLLGQPKEIKERMAQRVEKFAYNLMVNVFNSKDTAQLAIEMILKAGSYDAGSKATRIENPDEWTNEMIIQKATSLKTGTRTGAHYDD